jgi:hypothetical protein
MDHIMDKATCKAYAKNIEILQWIFDSGILTDVNTIEDYQKHQ